MLHLVATAPIFLLILSTCCALVALLYYAIEWCALCTKHPERRKIRGTKEWFFGGAGEAAHQFHQLVYVFGFGAAVWLILLG